MGKLRRPSTDWMSYEELGELIRKAKEGGYKTRLIAIRMLMDPHKSQKEVSKELLVSCRTLHRWVSRWNAEGPAGLQDRRQGNGRKAEVREKVEKELKGLEITGVEKVEFLREGQRVTGIALYGWLRKKKDKD